MLVNETNTHKWRNTLTAECVRLRRPTVAVDGVLIVIVENRAAFRGVLGDVSARSCDVCRLILWNRRIFVINPTPKVRFRVEFGFSCESEAQGGRIFVLDSRLISGNFDQKAFRSWRRCLKSHPISSVGDWFMCFCDLTAEAQFVKWRKSKMWS